MKKKKIVILGSTGMAGHMVYKYLSSREDFEIINLAFRKKLNESTDKNLKLQKEKLDAVSSQDNILKLQGKSEKDILKIKIAQVK